MSDQRFAALQTNPQYRLPNPGFRKKASVDRYGRKVKSNDEEKSLKKRFRIEEADVPARARAGAKEVVGSSEEESEDEDEDEEEDFGGAVKDPARHGGFSESSSEEDDDTEEDGQSEDEAMLADETAGREQTEDVPMGDPSRRIAAVNLDWDNIRAADIMVVANSFVPAGGKIQSVVIYPSEFGRERLEREQMDGPPREIFASSNRRDDDSPESDDIEYEDSDSDADAEEKIKKRLIAAQAASGQEFNPTKLREYQIERLKYYYAVISCDTIATAKSLSDAMDGRELLTTANIFDLRFIPDEVSFDDDRPHEECHDLPHSYKPNEFRTEALTHSKVRLTWDDDDPARKEVQKRAFSRKEMDDNDMQAYIASDNSDADSISSRKSAAEERRTKKREAARSNMRGLLGLSEETAKKKASTKDEAVGDMQITFSAGLTTSGNGNSTSVFENEPQDEESTLARYIKKEKERKQRRKKGDKIGPADEDAPAAPPKEDAGFDDLFFTDPAAATKAAKAAKHAARQAAKLPPAPPPGAKTTSRAELALLLSDDEAAGVGHFDMREIEKAEKAAKRKGKSKKKGTKEGDGAVQDGFEVDAGDERFGALFERSEFAIDPSHTKFKGTKGMKTLLEEGRRKRKGGVEVEDDGEGRKRRKGEDGKNGAGDEVKGLVARLKKTPRKV
ncbi:pre-rRNA-processing protein esf1 [Oleoguttula sp. CCFEE 5521]